MNILPLSYQPNNYKINKNINNNQPEVGNNNSNSVTDVIHENYGRSLINFKSGLHKADKAFIDALANSLNLSKEGASTLKQIVTDFLKQCNLKSLGDIGEDRFAKEQSYIINKITNTFGLDSDEYEYFLDELTNRCDDGDDYVPKSIDDYNIATNQFVAILSKLSDVPFYDSIQNIFRFDKDQMTVFKNTVNGILKENNIFFLKQINDENILAELLDKCTESLDLSDFETNMLTEEILNWNSHDGGEYKSTIIPLDMDFELFENVCTKNKINPQFTRSLFDVMKQDAINNNFENVFEVVNNLKTMKESETNLLLSELAEEDKNFDISDLLIDLSVCAKTPEELALNMNKHKDRDAFYAPFREQLIGQNLQAEFAFSPKALEAVQEELIKRNPTDIEGGENKSLKQIAFEIADKYSLPIGAEDKIEEIVEEIDNLNVNDLDAYIMENLMI